MSNKLTIVDDGDADDADGLVCMRITTPLLMPDNVIDTCAICFAMVQHRPHVPPGLCKLCWECAEPLAVEAARRGEFHGIITPKTAREVFMYFKNKRN